MKPFLSYNMTEEASPTYSQFHPHSITAVNSWGKISWFSAKILGCLTYPYQEQWLAGFILSLNELPLCLSWLIWMAMAQGKHLVTTENGQEWAHHSMKTRNIDKLMQTHILKNIKSISINLNSRVERFNKNRIW